MTAVHHFVIFVANKDIYGQLDIISSDLNPQAAMPLCAIKLSKE